MLSFVATSEGKVEESEDKFLIFDVRLTSEYLEKVTLSESANIQNLLQIAISNENTVPSSDESIDPIMPNASLRGRAYMGFKERREILINLDLK